MAHPGEIAVQTRAGFSDAARRMAVAVRREMPVAARDFIATLPLVIAAFRDDHAGMHVIAIEGKSGFARALSTREIAIDLGAKHTMRFRTCMLPNQPLGLLFLDGATRRRMRANGHATIAGDHLIVQVDEVYGNCPSYIQPRRWIERDAQQRINASPPTVARALSTAALHAITHTDTFFVGTCHAEAGADVSHRGGPPGFVNAIDERTLVWPDYGGNRFYQTLGNLHADPSCGLLFIDYARGDTWQLSGRANIVWDGYDRARYPDAERLVRFELDTMTESPAALTLCAIDSV